MRVASRRHALLGEGNGNLPSEITRAFRNCAKSNGSNGQSKPVDWWSFSSIGAQQLSFHQSLFCPSLSCLKQIFSVFRRFRCKSRCPCAYCRDPDKFACLQSSDLRRNMHEANSCLPFCYLTFSSHTLPPPRTHTPHFWCSTLNLSLSSLSGRKLQLLHNVEHVPVLINIATWANGAVFHGRHSASLLGTSLAHPAHPAPAPCSLKPVLRRNTLAHKGSSPTANSIGNT